MGISGLVASLRVNRAMLAKSRLVLMIGFGGLLGLLAFAGYDGIRVLRQIQNTNDTVRDQFLLRTRVLERIRSDLYVSGTYVRDYLLEQEAGRAEGHRYSLLETRSDMDSALRAYEGFMNSQESRPFLLLKEDLEAYWKVLEPVFRWTPEQRQQDGYAFLRDEVFPRRAAMLQIADRIRAINESQLNVGKVEVETTFARFRGHLMLALGLTIALGLLLAGFSGNTILTLEKEAAGRLAESAKARTELQSLSARLVQVQEDERRSISRELHDEVGQSLTGVLVEMANLSAQIRAGDLRAVAGRAEEIKKLIENSISVVRNMALLLRPSMLDDLGLVPALQWQAREVSKRNSVRVKVSAEEVSEELPDEHKTCIYRIVQEALNNGVQHAFARNINVTVRQEDKRILLIISDDGRGFDAKQERGMGLVGIGERASHLGGKFIIDSKPGQGTALRVELPLAQPVPQSKEEVA